MLKAYREHAAERAALGIPPLALDAKQVAELGHEVKRLQAENDQMRPELIRLRLLTCGGRAEHAVSQRSDCRPDERDMI